MTPAEDLKSTALDILNNKNFNINQKIDFLIDFKKSTLCDIQILKMKKHPKKIIRPFKEYSDWLGKQIEILKNNGTHIVQ